MTLETGIGAEAAAGVRGGRGGEWGEGGARPLHGAWGVCDAAARIQPARRAVHLLHVPCYAKLYLRTAKQNPPKVRMDRGIKAQSDTF